LIKSFACKHTEKFYHGSYVKKFSGFDRQAEKRLRILNEAVTLEDLKALPSNRFESLKGDRKGQYSIRINIQWRICFKWDTAPFNVEIVDYH
jgi:toxin HigB-1